MINLYDIALNNQSHNVSCQLQVTAETDEDMPLSHQLLIS